MRSVAPAPNSIVSEVNNAASTTSTTSQAIYYDGLVDVPNPDRVLKADMTAQVTVVVAQAQDVVTIPSAALDPAPPAGALRPGARPGASPPAAFMAPRGPNQHLVLVVDSKGVPKPRLVSIGLNNKVTAQVLSGIEPGEKVVTGQASAGQSAANLPPPGLGGGRRGPPPGLGGP